MDAESGVSLLRKLSVLLSRQRGMIEAWSMLGARRFRRIRYERHRRSEANMSQRHVL